LFGLAVVSPLHAERADREKPVTLEADRVEIDDAKKEAIFHGNVTLTQGTLMMKADRIIVKQDADGFQYGIAYGNQAYFRQKREGVDEYIEGYADRLEYNGKADKVEMFAKAQIRRGTDEVRGDYIAYNAATEFFEVIVRPAIHTDAFAPRFNPAPEPRSSPPRAPNPCRSSRPIRSAARDRASADAVSRNHMSRLRAEKLNKRYKARTVVKDVSLEVESGEVVGLLGPNGAGKTTCFYMMVGLVRADGGDLFLDERALTHAPIHQRARLGLSYLPQEASIFRKLTVAENIQSVLELRGMEEEESEQRLDALLHDLHIAHLRNSPAISLSGGERRRVEIARALATQPRFILLDEPFAGVDPIAVLDIQKIIRFLKERSIGVLITDHNVRETLGICDRAYIINDGSVLACGHPEEIVYNESVRKVYLGEHFKL
jgi:lipopolysaccharide export system ATP-binding protein